MLGRTILGYMSISSLGAGVDIVGKGRERTRLSIMQERGSCRVLCMVEMRWADIRDRLDLPQLGMIM